MSKRSIRLKELGLNINKIYIPAKEYLANCPKLNSSEAFFIKTDNEGDQVSIYQNQSSRKIYLLGASTIESLYIKQSLKPQSILERYLLERGCNYSVKNLGVSGTQTLNIINLLTNKVGRYPGSIVVITLPSNDLGPLLYKDGYYSNHKYHASIIPAQDIRVKKNIKLDLNLYKKHLHLIKSICEILDLKLIFTSICYTGEDNNLSMLNHVARKYCLKHNLTFLDLEKKFRESESFFYDKLHFLPDGAQYFADKLFDCLQPFLIKDKEKKLDILLARIKNENLGKNIVWFEDILIERTDKIILTVEFKQLDNDASPALYAVDYGCIPKSTNLIKSANKNIGYYKYIEGVCGKSLERSYEIYVPENCINLRLGLRSWGGKGIYVYNAFVTVIRSIV